jgi:Rrf2 family protein
MENVLRISDGASIALHAMIIISQKKGDLASVRDIAKELNVSANHLSKILQRLVKTGLVKSVKGYGGGFKLAKKAEQTTFLEIYEAIDGRFKPTNCLLNRKVCCKKCIMGGFLKHINKEVEDYFKNTKLSDFNNNY